jgi:hypothetical protein
MYSLDVLLEVYGLLAGERILDVVIYGGRMDGWISVIASTNGVCNDGAFTYIHILY